MATLLTKHIATMTEMRGPHKVLDRSGGEPVVVLRHINVPLTNGQFDALVSFTFNLGSGALQRSTLRRKLNRQEYKLAANQFSRWVWAGVKKLKRLVHRRNAEATLFSSSPAWCKRDLPSGKCVMVVCTLFNETNKSLA